MSPRGPCVTVTAPPDLPAGHERRSIKAQGREDVADVLMRVKAFPWHVAIAGKPTRSGPWWLFAVETARLP